MRRSLRFLCPFEIILTQKENDKGKGREKERRAEEKVWGERTSGRVVLWQCLSMIPTLHGKETIMKNDKNLSPNNFYGGGGGK